MLKVRRFVIVFLVSIMCLLIAPFHVYAFSISQSNIQGVNVSVVDYKVIGENTFNQNYPKSTFILKFELVMDNVYLGYLTGKFTCSLFGYDSQGNSMQINVDSGNKSFYICGRSLTYYVEQTLYYPNTPTNTFTNVYTPSFTLAGSNVTDINYTGRMLEDIEDILYNAENIYTSVYDPVNGTVIEQLVDVNEELDFIHEMVYYINNNVANIENDTDILSKLRQYNVPIYSWNFVSASLMRLNLLEISSSTNRYTYEYPAFIIPNGYHYNYFCSSWVLQGQKFVLIYGIGGNLTFNDVITTNATSSNSKISTELLYNYRIDGNDAGVYNETIRIIKIIIEPNSNTSIYVHINNNLNKDIFFVPIVASVNVENYVTDEFRQQFGLVDKSHEEYLDDSTSRMQDEFNDMFDYEDDFNSDMNTALQNINVNFDVGNQLGSKFLASADWVRQQYNTLTSNTPFGTVLSFSLLLGLALLIIGKAVR